MTGLETELRATLHAIDQAPITDPGLESRVVAEIRRRRRTGLVVATSVAMVLATASLGLVFAVTGSSDKTASSTVAGDPRGGSDCTGMRAGAAGVSARGPANLVLGYQNEASGGAHCTIDADVQVSLTAGSVSVISRFDADPAEIPGQTTDDRMATLLLTWRNWCANGRVTATTTFGDGTTVVHNLGAKSDTPNCNDPRTPARLAITHVDIADVADNASRPTDRG